MAFKVTLRSYPLLKFAVPIALALLAVGLFLLFTQPASDGSLDPMVMLPWLIAGGVVALVGAAVKRRQQVEVPVPSDHLKDAPRTEVEGILEKLDEARAKGEISEDRYRRAKAKVTKSATAKKKR